MPPSYVGYQNVEANDGFTYLAPTFEKVDGSPVTLGDIVPVNDGSGFGTEIIQTFDEVNDVTGYYTYYCADMYKPEGAGWYDEDDNCCNDLEIGGAGIGILLDSPAATIQFAGAVTRGAKEVYVENSGFTYVANATPVEIDIQDFKVTTDGVGFGMEIIQTFDEINDVTGYYTYYCEDMYKPEGAGWYNEDDAKVTVPFAPGFGCLLDCQGDVTIELPKVLD